MLFTKNQKIKIGDLVRIGFYGDDYPSYGIVIDNSMNCLVGGHRVEVVWTTSSDKTPTKTIVQAKRLDVISAI